MKTLTNIAETNTKKETREEMQKAVSITRNFFRELSRAAGDKMRKEGKTKVMEDEIVTISRKETAATWEKWRHLLRKLEKRR